MPIIPECFSFLKVNATAQWHETFRFKNKETDEYLHMIQRGMVLLRVETGMKRAFYWIYNIDDAIRFNEFVGLQLKAEAHEIILTPRCRLFFDIDLVLSEFQKHEFADHYQLNFFASNENETMDEIGKSLAIVFKESTLISLEEHGIDIESDLVGFDYFYTMRNRALDDEQFKISIHLITNLIISLKACSAIVSHIKNEVIPNNIEVLGINEDMIESLVSSIDETQYRRHGSLSLPFGTKFTSNQIYTNWIYRDYSIPKQRFFITLEDQFSIHDIDLGGYNIVDSSAYSKTEVCPEFVKEALKHVSNIKDFNNRVWDINSSVLKRSTMYVKRCSPSMCSACKRAHDNDNTLFLIFNSDKGVASWKCARMPDMRPIVFYRQEESNEDINAVEAFKQKYDKRKVVRKTQITKHVIVKENHNHRNTIDDIEAFSKKHREIKALQTKDVFDPFEKAPYKPKRSFIRRNPLPPPDIDEQYDYTNAEYIEDEIISQPQKSIKTIKKPKKKAQSFAVNEYIEEEEPKKNMIQFEIKKRIGNKSRILHGDIQEY